jgi:UDP-N-acetylglucosamine 2-epimerase (non-hydrolysing)
MKILCVFGTRPEAIKMAPVVRELNKYPQQVQVRVCVTAQHREMLDQVLNLFGIEPHHDLDIMQEDQSLTEVTCKVLQRFEEILLKEKPDLVLVQGDTTTAMAGAIAAFYQKVKVGHVEAGLRTWEKFHPYPEEINRKIADMLCDYHFAPTQTARQNLLREGIDDRSIFVTGNTVIDALHWISNLPLSPQAQLMFEKIGLQKDDDKRILLVTAHRRENFGRPIENICHALLQIANEYRDTVHIVYPVHLNSNVQKPARSILGQSGNITLLEPLDYLQLVHLMKRAYLVLTDSGGIQEEAPGLAKPVLVLREFTERPEAVEAGTVKVVGTDTDDIVRETRILLDNPRSYDRMARAVNPYGDGHAAERISQTLLKGNPD